MPINLPAAPTRDGYIFGGWYNTPDFSGEELTGSYYNGELTTIYAKWLTYEEFEAQFAGTTMGYAIEMTPGVSETVEIEVERTHVFYKFTVTESGKYAIYTNAPANPSSYNANDTMGYLYNSLDGMYIYSADKDERTGDWDQFYFEYDLEAGVTYYIEVYFYSSGTGAFELNVEKV